MTTERDPRTRIVLSWLREDAHEDAERVLARALGEVDTTPQRRPAWPVRRISPMNAYAKATLAAAVVVVAVIGLQFLPIGSAEPTPTVSTASPVPTVTPVATTPPAATAVPSGPSFPPAGSLAAGPHSMALGDATLTFELVSRSWISNGEFEFHTGPHATVGGVIFFWDDAPIGIFSDPCGSVKAPPAGPSLLERAEAIASAPGTELVSGPSEVTVGGNAAQLVIVQLPTELGCPSDDFRLFYNQSNVSNGRYAAGAGDTILIWLVEVGQSVIAIDAETDAAPDSPLWNEILAITDSIRFE